MLEVPRIVAIEDNPAHLIGLANGLSQQGWPCRQIHFTEEEDLATVVPAPDVDLIFADLHLGGDTIATDHKTDFNIIGTLLDMIKPSAPYSIVLWTMYPAQASSLKKFLEERLDGVAKPSNVISLDKADHLDSEGRIKDEEALAEAVGMMVQVLRQADVDADRSVAVNFSLLPDPWDRADGIYDELALSSVCPSPEEITQRLARLFEPAEGLCEPAPPGFPGPETTLTEWLDAELPDLNRTPRQILRHGDQGDLFLLDRLVNAIATCRAISHPHAVREIVRHRVEVRFQEEQHAEPTISRHGQPLGRPKELFERWMNLSNPLFGNMSPRRFFDDEKIDGERLQEISSFLDAIDDGAFS